jgi:hypothetical protein
VGEGDQRGRHHGKRLVIHHHRVILVWLMPRARQIK